MTALATEIGDAYRGKRVLLTGHTGFKGGWLALWLSELGADVTGFALPPDTTPSFFGDLHLERMLRHVEGDLRDSDQLETTLASANPDVIFHLAAQSLVRRSYECPLDTVEVNVLGTARLLDLIRKRRQPCTVVIVTSDKCYENQEWPLGYRETDPMGGHDIYSTSKGAAELVVSGWRRSFFPAERFNEHGVAVATARAGNVIGGGDFAKDRILPDAIRALSHREAIPVRNPTSVRPWQFVLEPLGGYLLLGARLMRASVGEQRNLCGAWNFGPSSESCQSVESLVRAVIKSWGSGEWRAAGDPGAPHEAGVLRLSIEKAHAGLGWRPRWNLSEAVNRTVQWYRAREKGGSPEALGDLSRAQIRDYVSVEVS